MSNNTMFNKKETNEAMMTMSERRMVANAMVKAGHNNVKPEMICKVPNQYNFDVYVAVVGDAMVVYTPQWSHHDGMNFVCF